MLSHDWNSLRKRKIKGSVNRKNEAKNDNKTIKVGGNWGRYRFVDGIGEIRKKLRSKKEIRSYLPILML